MEFSTKSLGEEADKVIDMLEQNFKAKDLFLVTWQRQGQKIRIYSKFSDIMSAVDTKKFTAAQLELLQYTRIIN